VQHHRGITRSLETIESIFLQFVSEKPMLVLHGILAADCVCGYIKVYELQLCYFS
jgi:hypothetical protein